MNAINELHDASYVLYFLIYKVPFTVGTTQ